MYLLSSFSIHILPYLNFIKTQTNTKQTKKQQQHQKQNKKTKNSTATTTRNKHTDNDKNPITTKRITETRIIARLLKQDLSTEKAKKNTNLM